MDVNVTEASSKLDIDTKGKLLNLTPKLVCVQYPGIVKNTDKAIETLGGISGIEIATSTLKKNLELRFKPDNYYTKPCVADRDAKPSLLVKAKVKKDKSGQKQVIDYEVLGVTAVTFKFNKLCDFQYLPLVSKTNKDVEDDLEYIYNRIVPNEIPTTSWVHNPEAENMPMFLPPTTFSRYSTSVNKLHFDRSKFYEGRFTPEYYKKFKEQESQQKLYRKDKGKTIINQSAFFCNFEDEIPLKASQTSIDILSSKFTSPGAIERVKEFFDKRPIWSKQALIYNADVSVEQIKYILPTVAYYYISGPWRVMWVRLGYDPRNQSHCRIYQTFDYRIRAKAGFKLKVKSKRNYMMQQSFASKGTCKYSLKEEAEKKSQTHKIEENAFLLKPGMIPSARQMFYQYCDVHIPEIQAMLSRLPPVLPGTKCNRKNGWLPSGFTEQCREIANKHIGEQVRKEILEDKEETIRQEQEMGEQSETEDFLEISESSSSSSDSEDDISAIKNKEDEISENEIDLDALEEVNKIISMQNPTFNDPGEGCSKFI